MGRALRRRPRVLAFASVLLLTSGMVAVLVQEARAVDIVVTPPGRVGGVTDVEVEVRVPAGQRVPILATEAILERTQSETKVDPALVARARCQGAGSCNAAQLARSGSSSTAILGISFVNAYAGQVQPGNVILQGHFGYGALEVTVPGYGYSGAAGYGYLVGPGAAYGADQLGYGYGYGYGGEALILLYRVTIDAQVLGNGHYWLTFLVDSGSALIGTLSSPAQHFEVQLPGGGGGALLGPITLPPLELGFPISIPPVGAGQEVLAPLHKVNAALRNLTIVFAASIPGGQLAVNASSAPPAGAPPAEAFAILLFVDINLTQVPEGALREATLNYTLTPEQLGGRAGGQAVVLHLQQAWEPLPTGLLATEPDGNLTFAARIASLSSFALALDKAPPRVERAQPAPGSTVPPLHAISAELSDNRGLNVSSVSIFVDGQDVTRQAGLSDAGTRTAEGAPRGLALLYVPKVALLTGPRNVTVEASDVSGLRAVESWTFAVDRFPVVTPVAPPPAGCTNRSMPLIRADYVGSVAIDLSQVTMVVDNLPALEPDIGPGSIRYTPLQSLADGPHAVTVAATDMARRPGSATWSFHVDTVGPVIADVTPAEGAVVQTPRPLISASIRDDGCGIEPGSIALELDGRPVPVVWEAGVASYEPPHDLGAGRHLVRILAADEAGNDGRGAWSFVVERPCAVAGVPCWIVAVGLALLATLAGSVWWLRWGRGRRGASPPGERGEAPRMDSGGCRVSRSLSPGPSCSTGAAPIQGGWTVHAQLGIWSLCVLLTAPALAGCLSPPLEAALPTSPAGVQEPGAAPSAGAPASSPFLASGPDNGGPAPSRPPVSPAPEHASYSLTLPTILATRTIDPKLGFGGFFSVEGRTINLSVPPYSLPLDPRGIANFADVERVLQPGSKELALLSKNGITVHGGRSWDDIVQPYRFLAWNKVPIFVTTDTILHLYHILFDSTLKTLEEERFHPAAIGLSRALFEASVSDHGSLSGEPQEAARRNVAYFAVALRLLNQNVEVPAYVAQDVQRELDLIRDHSGFRVSPIFGYCEDYSQYVPRGHYTRSEALQQYFRAFMWFGRMAFLLRGDAPPSPDCSTPGPSDEDARAATTAALLLADALNRTRLGVASAREAWERIYTVTAFFVGLADDLTPLDYLDASRTVYAQPLTQEQLADDAKRVAFKGELATMPSPAIFGGTGICVLPAGEPLDQTDLDGCLDRSKGMRFMGQRFIPDSYIFQNLVLPVVGEYNGNATPFTQCRVGDGRLARCFPRGLDVAAVLDSERALEILREEGDTDYGNHTAALKELQAKFLNLTPQEWNRNLYFAWVYVLRSLLGSHGPGSPTFMRTEAWQDKDLNTFLASWTELRHDTILYAKQSYGAMPAMFHERPRVVGYVEPNAVFYACMAALTRMTRDGLEAMLALPEDLKDRFDRLENLIGRLYEISVMELANQPLSESDYDFIDDVADSLGSIAEGFDQADTRTTMVADVHTDPNTGGVLEDAVGRVRLLLVAYKVPDGRVLVGAGPVLSYYEFKHPMSDRLTDEAWVEMLRASPPAAPEWTASFQSPGG